MRKLCSIKKSNIGNVLDLLHLLCVLKMRLLILNVMMLAIGLGSSNYFDLNEGQSLTVSIESGIQNATVGITIGGLIMAPEAGASLSSLSLPSGVYGVAMYLVIIPFLLWKSNRSIS